MNLTDDTHALLFTENNIFIPVVSGITSSSSLESESLDLRPAAYQNVNTRFDVMNISIETRYPQVWENLTTNVSGPRGSTVGVSDGAIHINGIQGYNLSRIQLPEVVSDAAYVYVGSISINESQGIESGATGTDGQYMATKGDRRINIPSSASASQFIISEITLTIDNDITLKFSVLDSNTEWEVEIKMKYTGSKLTVKEVEQRKPTKKTYYEFSNLDITDSRSINLTGRYQSQGITTPNKLSIKEMDDLLYVNFIIN